MQEDVTTGSARTKTRTRATTATPTTTTPPVGPPKPPRSKANALTPFAEQANETTGTIFPTTATAATKNVTRTIVATADSNEKPEIAALDDSNLNITRQQKQKKHLHFESPLEGRSQRRRRQQRQHQQRHKVNLTFQELEQQQKQQEDQEYEFRITTTTNTTNTTNYATFQATGQKSNCTSDRNRNGNRNGNGNGNGEGNDDGDDSDNRNARDETATNMTIPRAEKEEERKNVTEIAIKRTASAAQGFTGRGDLSITQQQRERQQQQQQQEQRRSSIAEISIEVEEKTKAPHIGGLGVEETRARARHVAAIGKKRLTFGCSSLMYACQHGDIAEVLQQLRSKPESIRQRDSRNKNALHYCAAQSAQKRDLVAAASIAIAAPELLESADEDGFTPLHLAVIQGNLAMVNLLLANKADVNAVDNEGHSVVHWATVCGEVEALRSVLSAGAGVAIPDINGGTPLHYAAQMCGASYDSKLGQGNSTKLALEILGILLAHPKSSVDVQDKDGRQPLLWAASAGSAKAIIALVKSGARVESADKDGLTALHCAASRGHTECIDTLISLCGAPTDLIDANGCTALHYAVTLGHADATSRLLDLEAEPNRQDRKGRTPAHCGCSKGQFETVKLLKERGANLWLRNAKGDLPVHEAAASGRRELVAWLLEQQPKHVNTTSNDGRSLLHIAAANDYTDMCKMLLDYGGDINAIYRNSKGVVITPLDLALQKGNRSTAKFLQANGGLPAGKLRLAARRANPFHDATTDLVRPLKYAEKEEIHDLRSSKKYVVYMKRSDSDGGDEGNCSCTERTYKKEQRYAHKCRRHRNNKVRRRTSSCGEPKESVHTDEGNDICRSKSNIEITSRRSRDHNVSSSEWEGDENDEDSCENCCYHKRQKQRVLHRRRTTSLRHSKDYLDSDGEHAKISKREKRDKPTAELEESKEAQKDEEENKEPVASSRPDSKTSTRSRPQSATKRKTPPTTATKEGTFIKTIESEVSKSEVAGAQAEKDAAVITATEEEKMSTHALELTDEDDQTAKAAQLVTTQVEVHRSAEENKSIEETTESIEREIIKETVGKQASNELEEILQLAATAVASECKNEIEKAKEEEKEQISKAEEEKKEKTSTEDKEKNIETKALSTINKEDSSKTPTNQEKINDSSQKEDTIAIPTSIETTDSVLNQQETGASQTEKLPTEILTAAAPLSSKAKISETEQETSNTDAAGKQKSPPTTGSPATAENGKTQGEQESRRSFQLLPSDSADDEIEPVLRKSSFQVLKSDESLEDFDELPEQAIADISDSQDVFKIVAEHSSADGEQTNLDYEDEDYEQDEEESPKKSQTRQFRVNGNRHGIPAITEPTVSTSDGLLGVYNTANGRKRRLKRRVKSGGSKSRSNWKESRGGTDQVLQQQLTKDQDSGFEPSPRAIKTKIPAPRNIYTAYTPRRTLYKILDGRSCSGRQENRKPGDKGACDMTAVTRSIQRNIRRYYMERKIFQHLLELKSLQIRSNKLNEAVLVKRAVDDYHKSCSSLGGETGTRLRRYSFSEYSFKNFELFLYETLKTLQKPGTYNFQNINEVYEEAERRLSPDYNAYEKALQCTTKTHRCPHAIHAYTGIPCAAYIPMMNHHTMPKFGFGPYKKTGVSSFYLPKILTKSNSYEGGGRSGGGVGGAGGGTGASCSGKMALELTHGKSKQLISLPSDKLDSNKRYYVTFTVKETSSPAGDVGSVLAKSSQQQHQHDSNETTKTTGK